MQHPLLCMECLTSCEGVSSCLAYFCIVLQIQQREHARYKLSHRRIFDTLLWTFTGLCLSVRCVLCLWVCMFSTATHLQLRVLLKQVARIDIEVLLQRFADDIIRDRLFCLPTNLGTPHCTNRP